MLTAHRERLRANSPDELIPRIVDLTLQPMWIRLPLLCSFKGF